MNIHKNARLTPHGRERMVMLLLQGEAPKAVAEAAGVSRCAVRKWLKRYQEDGVAALRWYQAMGITPRRVMTDNGTCYKSFAFKITCKELGLKHIRTKPNTPQTNGKAERFIQTAMREWAYAKAYQTSDERAQHLPIWLHMHTWHRPHGGIKDQTPISRLNLKRNNLLINHS